MSDKLPWSPTWWNDSELQNILKGLSPEQKAAMLKLLNEEKEKVNEEIKDKELAKKWIEGWKVNEFQHEIYNFVWLDKEVALLLIKLWYAKVLFDHPHCFKWLDKEVALNLIELWLCWAIFTAPEKFHWLDKDVFMKLIEAADSGHYKRMIIVGLFDLVKEDRFTWLDWQCAAKLIELDNKRGLKFVSENSDKFWSNNEKTSNTLLENLDENNCCDRLLEAYKSFAGSEIVTHMSWRKVIDNPLFLPESYNGIMLSNQNEQIDHLDKLTKDDILIFVRVDGYRWDTELSLSEVDDWEPLLDDPIIDKRIRDKAKEKIIKVLREALTYKKSS